MTSHYRQTSPVLRGAWVLETLLGTPVPPPPPDVPPLAPVKCVENCVETAKTAVGMRQRILASSRQSRLHRVPQPDGPDRFRAREFRLDRPLARKEFDGSPIDAIGLAAIRRKVQRSPPNCARSCSSEKDDFLRHLTGKVLGYALGRSLQDGDSCTVQRLAETLAEGQLPRAHHDSRNRAEHPVPQQPGRRSRDGTPLPSAANGGPMSDGRPQVK